MKKANVEDPAKCYFVDDSRVNVNAARSLGWGRCVHFSEHGMHVLEGGKAKEIGADASATTNVDGVVTISRLDQLRTVWMDIFK